MSVTRPEIDSLLDKTEQNPFLLCAIASKRACDINNMIRGHFDDITTIISGKDTVSIAMDEIESGTLSFVKDEFDTDLEAQNIGII